MIGLLKTYVVATVVVGSSRGLVSSFVLSKKMMMAPAFSSSSSSSWSLMARKDRSTPIPTTNTKTMTKTKTNYEPRGPNQATYVQYLQQSNTTIVVGTGPAGCGKTLFACCAAVEAMKCGDVQKIILTRPVVSVEEELGFLPGNIMRKMDPWLQPLFDVFLEHYTQKELDRMIAEGKIEISPLGFMRGRTFKHCFILADEMQNSSPGQMLMLLTRIGEGSKLAVTGDVNQSDLPNKSNNGLSDFLDKYRKKSTGAGRAEGVHSYIQWVQMNIDDVERSPVVVQVLSMYEQESPSKSTKKPSDSDAALIPASHISRSSHFPKEPSSTALDGSITKEPCKN